MGTLLFRDEQPPVAVDPVAPAQRSAPALRKARSRQLEDGTSTHSLRTLLAALATLFVDTPALAPATRRLQQFGVGVGPRHPVARRPSSQEAPPVPTSMATPTSDTSPGSSGIGLQALDDC